MLTLLRRLTATALYLNNRASVSVEELSADSCPTQNFDVLKTNICLRSKASKSNMLVLRTSNSQGCVYCTTLNFLPYAS